MATDIRHQPENGYHSEPTQPSLRENLNRRSLMRAAPKPECHRNLGFWPDCSRQLVYHRPGQSRRRSGQCHFRLVARYSRRHDAKSAGQTHRRVFSRYGRGNAQLYDSNAEQISGSGKLCGDRLLFKLGINTADFRARTDAANQNQPQ